MVKAYDVPANELIDALASHVRKLPGLDVPQWAQFVKTGSHAERPPQQADWWYTRAASLLRKLYLHGPVGLNDLERVYGGSKSVGYNPKHHRDTGSSIIRGILKQLEQAELVTKNPKGRILTSKGVALLDRLSKDIFKKLVEENPSLARYG